MHHCVTAWAGLLTGLWPSLSLLFTGVSWSFTASHEYLEMLVDHIGDRMMPGPSLKAGVVPHPLQVPEAAASVDATRLTNT
jgi:hypothetical protein